MNKNFLIEVEKTEVRDARGNLLGVFKKPINLLEDENGKYIISKETGEKIYFEWKNIKNEELPKPLKPDAK